MTTTIEHYINDQRVSRDDRYQDVYNPATGEITGRVALASSQTVSEAVAAAQAAFAGWADTPPIRRARVLFEYLHLLRERKDDLARIIVAEHGKVSPMPRAKSTVASTFSNSPAASPTCSRASIPTRSPVAWTTGRCASRWVSWPASRRSTSR